MAGEPGVHPVRGRDGIEVADSSAVATAWPATLAPDVRADVVLAARAEEVADDLAAVDGDDAAAARRAPFELPPEVDVGRQQRLDRAVRGVPLGEQAGGAVEVLVGKRDDLGRVTGRRLAEMSPKTLTGEELQLDDAPARDAELFLVDGNNLAYRAYFALPEELATSEGFPTGALLGFTNMLFKLLSDYRPKGVAVAWDTRPVHRAELSETYKSERRPMPDLLREQFPYFRPIVEAFGYRNLEFEGWEADDVIATLATRADAAGVKHLRRLDRPRRVPARHRQRLPDDDAARRRGRERLYAGARRGAARDHRRQGAGLHRAEGRHVRTTSTAFQGSATRPPRS